MSSIDLTNPQVLRNFTIAQMREGKGEFTWKEKVLVFKGFDGSEYVVPEDVLREVEVVSATTGEQLIEEVAEPEVAGEEPKRKKKKILV